MLLSDKFQDGQTYTFECETRVSGDVDKEDRVSLTVNVDLSGAVAKDVINQDLAVKFQGAVRKSFETQGALRKWAEKRDNTYKVHVSKVGHKIESPEQLKAQIRAAISQLPEEEREQALEDLKSHSEAAEEHLG